MEKRLKGTHSDTNEECESGSFTAHGQRQGKSPVITSTIIVN
jgi:hypothetical protein